MSVISNFHGDNFFLSNFFSSPVVFNNETYPTVEHAFQAAKTLDGAQRRSIQAAETPAQAKQLGRKVTLRSDWEQAKLTIMLELLKQKFSRPDLREQLLGTGDAELIEGNTWGDRVWGCVFVDGQWVGQNHLGKLLMRVREEYKEAGR